MRPVRPLRAAPPDTMHPRRFYPLDRPLERESVTVSGEHSRANGISMTAHDDRQVLPAPPSGRAGYPIEPRLLLSRAYRGRSLAAHCGYGHRSVLTVSSWNTLDDCAPSSSNRPGCCEWISFQYPLNNSYTCVTDPFFSLKCHRPLFLPRSGFGDKDMP